MGPLLQSSRELLRPLDSVQAQKGPEQSPPPRHLLQEAFPGCPPAPPQTLGETGSWGVKGHEGGAGVPEAEARPTSGAQRAAMLEQRRRRRGASWVPAAAPVGWGHGPSRAAEGPSAGRQGGGPDGRLFRDPRPPPARPRPPTPPPPRAQRPHPGCATGLGSQCPPRAFRCPQEPCSHSRLGPREPQATVCPHPGSAWMGPFLSPILELLARPRGAREGE